MTSCTRSRCRSSRQDAVSEAVEEAGPDVVGPRFVSASRTPGAVRQDAKQTEKTDPYGTPRVETTTTKTTATADRINRINRIKALPRDWATHTSVAPSLSFVSSCSYPVNPVNPVGSCGSRCSIPPSSLRAKEDHSSRARYASVPLSSSDPVSHRYPRARAARPRRRCECLTASTPIAAASR